MWKFIHFCDDHVQVSFVKAEQIKTSETAEEDLLFYGNYAICVYYILWTDRRLVNRVLKKIETRKLSPIDELECKILITIICAALSISFVSSFVRSSAIHRAILFTSAASLLSQGVFAARALLE